MAASNERRALRTSTQIIRRGNGNSSCEYCLFTRGGAGTQARAGHTQLHWTGAGAGQAHPAHGRRAVARAQEIRAAEAALAGGVGSAGAALRGARMRAQGAAGKSGGLTFFVGASLRCAPAGGSKEVSLLVSLPRTYVLGYRYPAPL